MIVLDANIGCGHVLHATRPTATSAVFLDFDGRTRWRELRSGERLMKTLAVLLLMATAQVTEPDQFALPRPDLQHTRKLTLSATSYYIVQPRIVQWGIPLLDMRDKPLGPVLSELEWCWAAQQGIVRITGQTYNVAGSRPVKYDFCSKYFDTREHNLGGSRFKLAHGPYGDGASGFNLVPYRTLAVEKLVIPLGSVVFIPQAVGTVLPNGKQHDGYFFAGDVTASVLKNHIDVFQGLTAADFSFTKFKQGQTVTAFVITDPVIVKTMTELHRAD